MARIEQKEIGIKPLPQGNQWEFSDRNEHLKPWSGWQEFRDLSEVGETLRKLVGKIQGEYIQEGWNFTAVVRNDSHFAVVFTNPSRDAIVEKCPPLDFLKPGLLEREMTENMGQIPTGPIDGILVGTNLYVNFAYGSYNELGSEVKRGLIFRKPQKLVYYQTGITCIHVWTNLLEHRIAGIEASIESVVNKLSEELEILGAEKSYFSSLYSPDPKRLF